MIASNFLSIYRIFFCVFYLVFTAFLVNITAADGCYTDCRSARVMKLRRVRIYTHQACCIIIESVITERRDI